MAIQFAVSSGLVQHEDKQACRWTNTVRKSHRGHVCPNKTSWTIQSRGPSHDYTHSNDLVVNLLPLVKRVALQFRAHLPAHVELDDLVSEGTVGLIDAVRKFDTAKGVTIESYARYRIRGAILDSLRDQDHASRDMRKRIKKVESTCRRLEHRLRRPAEDAEMAEAMGLGLAEWHARVAELQRLGFEGPGSRISPEVGKRVNEEDLPAGADDSPFTRCYRREKRDLLSTALGCLTDRQRSIIILYYKDALTMKQIGNRLGIDESRVSQLHSGALTRLRGRVAELLRRPASTSGSARLQGKIAAQARKLSGACCPGLEAMKHFKVLIGDVIAR